MNDNDGYITFQANIEEAIGYATKRPLFTTDTDPKALWGHFIMNLPEEHRQHYNCNACKTFIQQFGGLLVQGLDPAMWRWPIGGPEFFRASVAACCDLVSNSKITGVFLSSEKMWGKPSTISKKTNLCWSHLHGVNNSPWVSDGDLLTASQKMAELTEDYTTLKRAFGDWSKEVVAEGIRVLKADVLTRPEKALAIAEWFLEALSNKSDAGTWIRVAKAPKGFCHVRNTVVATLFDDVKAGKSFEEASKRWAEKMHPLQYQRPTKAATEGNVARAEEIISKLGIERSFERRYARLEDVLEWVWRPVVPVVSSGSSGVSMFSHLLPKNSNEPKRMELPTQEITWHKFKTDVLPKISSMEVLLPPIGTFFGLVTAVHADAPVILQWSNNVSWYIHHGGSTPSQWHLSGLRAKVVGIIAGPDTWGGYKPHDGADRIGFILEGARDDGADLCLFPEILRGELREIRSTVELYNKTRKIQDAELGTANGLLFSKGNSVHIVADGDRWFVKGWE